jgi:predicted dehydrogenase
MRSSTSLARRSFLKTVLCSGAAPFLLPSRIWSAGRGPNEAVRLGFIGCGIQSRGLLGGFLKLPDTRVVAVCDVDTTRRENHGQIVAEHYSKQTGVDFKGCSVHNDFRELLARADVDAVVIATPDHWHAVIAVAAAAAGKDIYCEKPLTNTIQEARALANAVQLHQRVFQTGSMQRSSREFRVACELVRNGVLGKVSRVTVGFGGPAKPCDLPGEAPEAGLDWDLWLGPAPQREYNSILSPRGINKHFPAWRAYREYGGGGVTDWGAHHLDIAHWALGMDRSGPLEILPPEDWKTASSGARLLYPGGVEVTHVAQNGVTFFGADGELYVNRGKFKLTVGGQGKASFLAKEDLPGLQEQLDAVEKEYLKDPKVRLYASTDHKADFLSAIKSRKQPVADVETGARTVIGCHLISLAYYHGQKLLWNPTQNGFVTGSGNSSWLHTEYRGNWKLA